MFIALVFSLVSVGVASGTESQPRSWEIKPSVCITAKPDQLCEMQVSVTLPTELDGKHCLFSDDVEIICWQRTPRQFAFQLALREDARLELRNPSDDAVFSQLLQVKARSSGRQRRRVRQPWSIF